MAPHPGPGRHRRRRVARAGASALVLAAALAGCGATPRSAAERFVTAVAEGDRATYCRLLSNDLLFDAPNGRADALRTCESRDIFILSGSYDIERGIARSSVDSVHVDGDEATARLRPARLELVLTRLGDDWLVTDIRPVGPRSGRRLGAG